MRSPNIYEMLDTLTLKQKEELSEYLNNLIEAERNAPPKSYLEEQWDEIIRLIECLSYEPYIDDQLEIEEVWDIVENVIKSKKLKNEILETRMEIITDIIENDFYDYYSVTDPMQDLFRALIFTNEEKLEAAELIYTIGSDYMKRFGATLYKECGHLKEYYNYVEDHLERDPGPYMELINYYKDIDRIKAVSIAERGMKKCSRGRTDIIIFMIQDAQAEGDEERVAKLINSAKRRQYIDYDKVIKEINK